MSYIGRTDEEMIAVMRRLVAENSASLATVGQGETNPSAFLLAFLEKESELDRKLFFALVRSFAKLEDEDPLSLLGVIA